MSWALERLSGDLFFGELESCMLVVVKRNQREPKGKPKGNEGKPKGNQRENTFFPGMQIHTSCFMGLSHIQAALQMCGVCMHACMHACMMYVGMQVCRYVGM